MNQELKYVLIVSIFIAWGVQNSSAQRPDEPFMTRFLALGKPGKGQSLSTNISFSGLRFIDNRIDTSCIGFVRDMYVAYPNGRSAWSGRTGKVNFKNVLTAELNNYVDANFGGSFSGNKDSLLIVINYFRVSSVSDEFSSIEPQIVKVKLLFAKKYAERISKIGEYDGSFCYKKRSCKIFYVDCIKKALADILLKASSFGSDTLDPPGGLTENEFLAKYVNRAERPVLQDSALKRGVYANFEQAIANSPQYPDYEPRYEHLASYDIVVKDKNGAVVRWDRNWGYSDGKRIYVFGDPSMSLVYPLIKKGNSLIISLESADSAADRSRARIGNAFMLILAGLSHGVAGGPVDYSVQQPKTTEMIGGKTYETAGIEINPETGRIDF
jgi:hypothetical protein